MADELDRGLCHGAIVSRTTVCDTGTAADSYHSAISIAEITQPSDILFKIKFLNRKKYFRSIRIFKIQYRRR